MSEISRSKVPIVPRSMATSGVSSGSGGGSSSTTRGPLQQKRLEDHRQNLKKAQVSGSSCSSCK